jgi:hypothetical protein
LRIEVLMDVENNRTQGTQEFIHVHRLYYDLLSWDPIYPSFYRLNG